MDNLKIKPTTQWMAENYNKYNKLLFGGSLGECNFEVFTKGVGSNGRRLGHFYIGNKNIMADGYSRRLYINTYGDREYIDTDNFYICEPTIGLNGNYSATEEAWLGVLIHEMVHYADYSSCIAPKQAHGPNFRFIAQDVYSRSNGRFSIHRLANADEMSNFQLDQSIEERNKARKERKIENLMAIFVYRNRTVGLTIIKSDNEELLEYIYDYNVRNIERTKFTKMFVSKDPKLIEFLSEHGYNKVSRTYRYWDVTTKDWLGYIGQFELYRYNGK